MGANFQVFLIAAIPGHAYRCVGAFNHFSCYGTRPLRGLYRFFSLLRVRENAALVRDELRLFSEWHLRQDDPPEPWMNPAVPCPYAVSLLAIAWTTDLENLPYLSNYSPGNGLLDARNDCWHRARKGVDQEGICVIDISNIQAPAYCFIRRPDNMVYPHTAWHYLRECYPSRFARIPLGWTFAKFLLDEKTEHQRFMHALEAFWALVDLAGYPLVPALTLLDVWPTLGSDLCQHKQLKVPPQGDLPMLDVVISLYLGRTNQAFPASFARMFNVEEPHLAIAKAILPPYELGSAEDVFQRTVVLQTILAEPDHFEFVLDYPYSTSGWFEPPYTFIGEVERFGHVQMELSRTRFAERMLKGMLPSAPFPTEKFRAWVSPIMPLVEFMKMFAKLQVNARNEDPRVQQVLSVTAMEELGESTFLDLSGFELSMTQIIDLLNRTPGVEALSLSGNSRCLPKHLPAILNSVPSLRRLHVMHWTGELFSDLQSVYSTNPRAFRQLEGLVCPPLLSFHYPAPPFISFAFHHITRITTRASPFISVPFFTPSQVVQTLTDVLPLAFQENRYGESLEFWGRNLGLAMQMGPNSFANPAFGVPFYMASPMLIHASLSGGAPLSGQSWNERRILCIPSHGDANLFQAQDGGIWVFHFDWDHNRHRHRHQSRRKPGRNQWGFVHYDVVERCTIPEGSVPGEVQSARNDLPGNGSTAPEVPPPRERDAPSESHKKRGYTGMIFMNMHGPLDPLAHITTYDDVGKMAPTPARGYPVTRSTVGFKLRFAPTMISHAGESEPLTHLAWGEAPPTRAPMSETATKTRLPESSAGDRLFPAAILASPATPLLQEARHHSPSTPGGASPSDMLSSASSLPSGSVLKNTPEEPPDAVPKPREHLWLRFAGTVHDLHGFLRCMADEGRALPSREATERLERILDTRDPESAELVCRLMPQDAELPLTGWRRVPTEDERKQNFGKEYGAFGPDAAFWTPSLFPARLPMPSNSTRAKEDPSDVDSDSDSENYPLSMI